MAHLDGDEAAGVREYRLRTLPGDADNWFLRAISQHLVWIHISSFSFSRSLSSGMP